jgi:hypothetical protein
MGLGTIGVNAFGEGRRSGRLDTPNNRRHPLQELLTNKRKRKPAEVGPAPRAANEKVGLFVDLRHLEEGLFADHGLMHQHMVEDAAEGVLGVGIGSRGFHRLGNSDAEAPGRVRILRANGATRIG